MARNNKGSFFIILFVLLVEFSLVTANIIATTIPAAYAEKGVRAAVPAAKVVNAEAAVAMVIEGGNICGGDTAGETEPPTTGEILLLAETG
jgi:hypothetical protein